MENIDIASAAAEASYSSIPVETNDPISEINYESDENFDQYVFLRDTPRTKEDMSRSQDRDPLEFVYRRSTIDLDPTLEAYEKEIKEYRDKVRGGFCTRSGFSGLRSINSARVLAQQIRVDHSKRTGGRFNGQIENNPYVRQLEDEIVKKYSTVPQDERYNLFQARIKNGVNVSRAVRSQIETQDLRRKKIFDLEVKTENQELILAIQKITTYPTASDKMKQLFLEPINPTDPNPPRYRKIRNSIPISEVGLNQISLELANMRANGDINLSDYKILLGEILDNATAYCMPALSALNRRGPNVPNITMREAIKLAPEFAKIFEGLERMSEEYKRIEDFAGAVETIYQRVQAISAHDQAVIKGMDDQLQKRSVFGRSLSPLRNLVIPLRNRGTGVREENIAKYKQIREDFSAGLGSRSGRNVDVNNLLQDLFVRNHVNESTFTNLEEILKSFGADIDDLNFLLSDKIQDYYVQVKGAYFDGNVEFMATRFQMYRKYKEISNNERLGSMNYEDIDMDFDQVALWVKAKNKFVEFNQIVNSESRLQDYQQQDRNKDKKYSQSLKKDFTDKFEPLKNKVEEHLGFALVNSILKFPNPEVLYDDYEKEINRIDDYIDIVMNSNKVSQEYKDNVQEKLVPILNNKRKQRGEMPIHENYAMRMQRIDDYRAYTKDAIQYLDVILANYIDPAGATNNQKVLGTMQNPAATTDPMTAYKDKIKELVFEVSWYANLRKEYEGQIPDKQYLYLLFNPLFDVQLRSEAIVQELEYLDTLSIDIEKLKKSPNLDTLEYIDYRNKLFSFIEAFTDTNNNFYNIAGNKNFGSIIKERLKAMRNELESYENKWNLKNGQT